MNSDFEGTGTSDDEKDEIGENAVRKLPNMNEFSPGVLGTNHIRQLLSALQPHDGDKEGMVSFIAGNYPSITKTGPSQRIPRAKNVLIGMSQCGLLEKDGNTITGKLSALSQTLIAEVDDERADNRFAKHLLEDCNGLELIDGITLIKQRGETVSAQAIREELRSRGFVVTENESNASKIRQWMESTGLVDSDWNIDDAKLAVVIGATVSTLGKWNSLNRGQRAFLEQLKFQDEHHQNQWIAVRTLKHLCESARGRSIFPEGRLRAEIIDPLAQEGWLETSGTGGGRGGDSGNVRATDQLRNLRIKLPVEPTTSLPVELRNKLSIPIAQIISDLDSPNTYDKGIALELLALRLIRDIGLLPVCFRERSNKTQGAEVDLIANGVNLHYSRWLVQCKNTKLVTVGDIAKEVGMAVVLKAHVIMMVSTGSFSGPVSTYASGLASSSTLQAVLIDGKLLAAYQKRGAPAILEWLQSNAYRVLALKEGQVQLVDET